MANNVVRLGGGSTLVFDWDAFGQLRRKGLPLAMEAGEKLARAAERYPAPADSKTYAVRVGKYRSAAVVSPKSRHAKNSNAKHNTLVKLLGKAEL